MKTHGGCDTRDHISAATALGRAKVTSRTLGRLYPGKAPVITLQEAAWTPEPVWTRKIHGATALKSQDRMKWLLPDGSAGGLVVSKVFIAQF